MLVDSTGGTLLRGVYRPYTLYRSYPVFNKSEALA